MKKIFLIIIVTLMTTQNSVAQEWMTSLDAAKRIALIQDKLLFMVWEDAATIPYPVIVNDTAGNELVFEDLFGHQEINKILWEYFVPVKVSEHLYAELFDDIKDIRSKTYIEQFEDDNIKIMDVNGMIVNTSNSPEAFFNLTEFITNYAINTAYLKSELDNYAQRPDFNSAYRLASKYFDYAILVGKDVRTDVIQVANMYLDNADRFLLTSGLQDKAHLSRKIELLRLSGYLIQDKPRKVLRTLKKLDLSELDASNQDLLAFLYYTAYVLNKDKKNTEAWKSKVTSINLKRAELITNINL